MSEANDPTDPLDAARDRLVDRLLAEAIGRESPPDRSGPILEAWEAMRVEPAKLVEKSAAIRTRWGALALVSAGCVLCALMLPSLQANREAARRNAEHNGVLADQPEPLATAASEPAVQAAAAPVSDPAAPESLERRKDLPASPSEREMLEQSAVAKSADANRYAYGPSAATASDSAGGWRDLSFGGRGDRPLIDQGDAPAPPSTDKYAAIAESAFIKPVGADALSTFSVDVDTASYTNVRQMLVEVGRLPPRDAVRVEEMINYFDYDYPAPAADGDDPLAASMEVGRCPWDPRHRLVRIGLKGREVAADKRPLSNLVFLVDVSGSMNEPNKLPLVVEGLRALADRLGENDRVAIVVYAGSEGLVLPSTSGERRDEIRSALGRLQAGGSTAGGAGLRLAYEVAERNRIPGGVNRVVLCTDGDFNVGVTDTEELARMAEARAKETGVFLTVLGFGRGNLNDALLEGIAARGDGHYAYIDSESEARRVLSQDLAGTLVTIAKDVKLQVEFNPARVAAYRLVGYENRALAAADFNNDQKDAGDIGAGHTVTALYEIVPAGTEPPAPAVDGLKYQPPTAPPQAPASGRDDRPVAASSDLLTLKIRYKQPSGGASTKLEFPLADPQPDAVPEASADFRWAAAVAQFGMILRGSAHAGDATLDGVLELARPAVGEDPTGRRAELLDLVRRAKGLRSNR